MALVAFNKSTPSGSCFQRTITLLDWWLTKPESNADTNTIGVAGLASHQSRAARGFSSAPILKIYDLLELETVDGVCIVLQGFINKDRTLENGFSPEIFDHFVIGFPHNWKEFTTNCPKRESASKCFTRVQKDVKDSIVGHGDFHCKKQNFDSNTVDMGVQVCDDIMFSNKTITPLNSPSVEISQEHVIEARSEVICMRSPVTPGFEGDPSLDMSSIVSNTVDSSTGSKSFGLSSRRMTRSMKKMDNSKLGFPLVNGISNLDKGTPNDSGILNSSENLRKSESRNVVSKLSGDCGKGSSETASFPKDTVLRMKLRRKQFVQNVDVVSTKDRKCISSEGKNKDDADLMNNIFLTRTNIKGCRNKKKSRVNVPQNEGVPATDGINSKEAIMTRSKSKSKMPVKRKLLTRPKAASSTFSSGKKGSEERYGSANIISPESFSGKKSRSGRIVLPPLEFWRNQMVVYDEDRQLYGVQEPK